VRAPACWSRTFSPSRAAIAAISKKSSSPRRRGNCYRIEESSLTKLSESIRDTPQSIATISKELLDDRGVTTLNDALRNTPGITLGAGEFSWQGNNPTIRGLLIDSFEKSEEDTKKESIRRLCQFIRFANNDPTSPA
jgi:outer membrane receptor for monomeric catechols